MIEKGFVELTRAKHYRAKVIEEVMDKAIRNKSIDGGRRLAVITDLKLLEGAHGIVMRGAIIRSSQENQ